MTKQEVKQEAKDSDGNPLVKGKIRRLQRDFARRRMMQDVATATAVIVNPTHYAVALRYDHETMATPMVVAKGKNYLALRIRQRALEHNIPLVENPPLAQALYKSVDVGKEIPGASVSRRGGSAGLHLSFDPRPRVRQLNVSVWPIDSECGGSRYF